MFKIGDKAYVITPKEYIPLTVRIKGQKNVFPLGYIPEIAGTLNYGEEVTIYDIEDTEYFKYYSSSSEKWYKISECKPYYVCGKFLSKTKPDKIIHQGINQSQLTVCERCGTVYSKTSCELYKTLFLKRQYINCPVCDKRVYFT